MKLLRWLLFADMGNGRASWIAVFLVIVVVLSVLHLIEPDESPWEDSNPSARTEERR